MEPMTAGIVAGGALLGQGINAMFSNNNNKKQRQWNEKMYGIQKQDSIDFWNMQNSYNSPEQQMQRLRDAGLNPHLQYGSGSATGNAAGSPDVPKAMAYNPEAPRIDMPAIVNSFYDVKQKAAVTDNTRLQGDILKLEAEHKAIENRFLAAYLTERNDKAVGDKRQSYLRSRAMAYENMFRTGESQPFYASVGDGKFADGSFYDLQAKGMALTNKLRGQESQAKTQDYDINSLRKNYYERVFSPDASALSFKDWLQLILQGANALK